MLEAHSLRKLFIPCVCNILVCLSGVWKAAGDSCHKSRLASLPISFDQPNQHGKPLETENRMMANLEG